MPLRRSSSGNARVGGFARQNRPVSIRTCGDGWLAMRAVVMGVPEEAGGDGAGLLELALLTEEFGRRVAPVPLVEAVVTARLLARATTSWSQWAAEIASGDRLVTLALHPGPGPQLVPGAAVADAVVGLVHDELVLAALSPRPGPGRQPGVRAHRLVGPGRRQRRPDRCRLRAGGRRRGSNRPGGNGSCSWLRPWSGWPGRPWTSA